MRCWAVALLPGLLLRSLIPVGFMPMFGPGFSVGMMLCPAYATVPDVSSGSSPRADGHAPADAGMPMMGMDMPGMDMSVGTSMDMSTPAAAGKSDHNIAARTASAALPPEAGDSTSGNRSDHQDHPRCPYAASATLAGVPAPLLLVVAEPPPITATLAAPQIAYFQITPRAQSARAPPQGV